MLARPTQPGELEREQYLNSTQRGTGDENHQAGAYEFTSQTTLVRRAARDFDLPKEVLFNVSTNRILGRPVHIAFRGDFAYILVEGATSDHRDHVLVYEVSATGATRRTALEFDLPSSVQRGLADGIAISGNFAYITHGFGPVTVYELSNTASTRRATRDFNVTVPIVSGRAFPDGLAVEGGYAYSLDAGPQRGEAGAHGRRGLPAGGPPAVAAGRERDKRGSRSRLLG